MKDNFSDGAKEYAQFRPHYPTELFEHILSLVKEKNLAWDCGTGNGQVAGILADHFKNVYATDISRQQLDAALKRPNIHYNVQPAENPIFSAKEFDLITVAQAIHWFRFDAFYTEVKRTLKPGGIFAVLGYGPIKAESRLQDIIDHFYKNIIGPYWDAERRYIDEHYKTIPFPFDEISIPALQMQYQWSFEQLVGYLNTWSAVKHYSKQHHTSPLVLIQDEMKEAWGDLPVITFSFPLLARVGR